MYVANQADKDWLQNEQGKLHKRGLEDPSYVFRKLWGLVTDPRNLRIAVARVASNRGRRSPGVDGVTVRTVLRDGIGTFVANVRAELRSGNYRPSPVRRVYIPKAGQPGKHRALGIPTVKDRVQWETRPAFVKLSGEPGAQRKVHAGFGRGRPETDPT